MVTESVNAAGETVAPREVHHDAATGASYGVKSPVAEDDTTARMIEQSPSSRSYDRHGMQPRFAMYAFFFPGPCSYAMMPMKRWTSALIVMGSPRKHHALAPRLFVERRRFFRLAGAFLRG
jgi:hypothetical protein